MADYSIILFVVSSLVIILSPGQDMVLILSNSIARGAKAGVVTAAGISIGLLGHTILVALGVGAILQASPIAFDIMKYVGAAYLLYLGIKSFRAPIISIDTDKLNTDNLSSYFMMGALSNISNPKVAIFYFAYLPQFLQPGSTTPNIDLFMLGVLFAALTFLAKLPVGYLAGIFSHSIKQRPHVQTWINRISGVVLIAMSSKLAVGL